MLVVSECAASYVMERVPERLQACGLATLFFDFLCHTFYDYKPHADLAVGMRAKNLKRKMLYCTKRGLYYA